MKFFFIMNDKGNLLIRKFVWVLGLEELCICMICFIILYSYNLICSFKEVLDN